MFGRKKLVVGSIWGEKGQSPWRQDDNSRTIIDLKRGWVRFSTSGRMYELTEPQFLKMHEFISLPASILSIPTEETS